MAELTLKPSELNELLDAVNADDIFILNNGGETKKIRATLLSQELVRLFATGGGAGLHNSLFRGKNLGNSFTAEQQAQIKAGTFNDLWIGDYWVIGGVTWRIADFDYWLHHGDASCETHHAVIVPDGNLYNAQMHNTSSGNYEAGVANTTEGGIIGSDMYKTNLANAKATIKAAFGESHILIHREYLVNTVSGGHATNGSWYDSDVELMNECMVYGSHIFEPGTTIGTSDSTIPANYTIDTSQLALFRLDHSKICNRADWWLRDVVSAADFAYVGGIGNADFSNASHSIGVRPAFGIC